MRGMRRYGLTALMCAVLLLVMAGAANAGAYVKQSWVRFGATAGEDLATGDVVCLKAADGKAYQADASDALLRPAVGIVGKDGASGDKVEIVAAGVFGGYSALTEGGAAYLSETAGAITQVAPAWSQQIGFAVSATEYVFGFQNYFDTSNLTALGILTGATPIILEGATANDFETTVAVTDPTADRTITLPNASGYLALMSSEELTATSDGVAASLLVLSTIITTNGDADLDNVTLADGVIGQVKIFTISAETAAGDSVKITPANFNGGTQITFDGTVGDGCVMVFDGTAWNIVANNGGTIA